MAIATWEEKKQLGDPQTISFEEVGEATKKLLSDRGWVKWRCAALGGDIIVVVVSMKVEGYPVGLPLYTVDELEKLEDMDADGIRLVHEAKKAELAGWGGAR